MIGIISSRLLGILSPDFRYRLISINAKVCFSFSSEVEVTKDESVPAQTSTGVLLFGFKDAGASVGNPAPMLTVLSVKGLCAPTRQGSSSWSYQDSGFISLSLPDNTSKFSKRYVRGVLVDID